MIDASQPGAVGDSDWDEVKEKIRDLIVKLDDDQRGWIEVGSALK